MDSIEEQLNQVDWKNLESISRFYESNQLYYDNYEVVEDQNKISDFIDIKLHYANALYRNCHYDKVLRILSQVQDLLRKLNEKHWNFVKSERYVRFMKGKVFGERKDFRASYSIFKQLVEEDPEHYYYWVWYYHTKLGLYSWAFNAASAIGIMLVFFDLIFSMDKIVGVDVGILGVIIAGLSYLVHKGLYEYYKRKKSHAKARV